MTSPFKFHDKTIFVAGGTSGINLGIAKNFAANGGNVIVMSRSQDKVDAAVETLSSYGFKSMGFSADVRDYDAVENAFSETVKAFGEIDVLVSGAAGNFPARATDMSPNAFKSVIDIDLLGSYHVLRASYPHLKKPGASVINISAPQAFVPMQLQSHVCAAKAGIDMLTRTLAMEWGAEKIRVNSIVPGPIKDTEGMARLAPTPAIIEAVKQSVPLQELGNADDIANAAMFLSSPVASYISGAILPVDGGWSLSGAGVMMDDLVKLMPK
ncbi:MAG: NAD(P)-dependent dehydrogenase (short-subunit alcohol dehydrogenase family) [Cocleimonas sp.]|jgi:NAD(P)-dependent dehydrogenase (short-subunit alcohol dehydrogenase family)